MDDVTRARIIETARIRFDNLIEQYEPRFALLLTAQFRDGIIYGSQDAQITNAVNALWEERRLELANKIFEETRV